MWRTSCMCNSWCKLWRLRWDSKLKAMKAIHLPLGFSYARLVEKMCLNSCQASRLHFIGNHCLYMQLGCHMLQNHLDLSRFFCCSTSFEPLEESLESTDWQTGAKCIKLYTLCVLVLYELADSIQSANMCRLAVPACHPNVQTLDERQ